MREHRPPGAALAVTYQGRLVYARGFGHADVEKKEPLFRIASVSKPFTAAAALHLMERHEEEHKKVRIAAARADKSISRYAVEAVLRVADEDSKKEQQSEPRQREPTSLGDRERRAPRGRA